MSATNGSEASASNDSVLQFFTAREQQLIMHALVCMKDFPAINYDKIADRMGMKNPRSVANAWGALKKKIVTFDKEERKRKGLPSEDEHEEADGGEGKSGPKTPKRRAPKAGGTPGSGKRARTATTKSARGKKGVAVPPARDDEDEVLKAEINEVGSQIFIKPDPAVEEESMPSD